MRRYPERPLIGVGAVIIKNGKILLVKRAKEPNKGKWSIPGGLVRRGETLIEALRREIKEELNSEIEVGDVAFVTEEIFLDERGEVEYHYVIVDFYSELYGIPTPSSDAEECRWFELNSINENDVAEFVLKLIEEMKKGSKRIYLERGLKDI